MHVACRPDQANARCAGTSVANWRFIAEQVVAVHSMRLRCSGRNVRDLVPAYLIDLPFALAPLRRV